jgi:predicted metal-binding membrane protein
MLAFLGGYAAVWTVFGAAALAGDATLHRMVHASPWLGAHPNLIAGSVLAVAGVFQFTPLKERCLRECRHPGAFLLQHYQRGIGAAFRLGRKHGVFCLGCCWALMLLMFAVGVTSVVWMAGLAAVMVYEKTGRLGRDLTPVAGAVLLVWGGFLAGAPTWLPPVLRVG